MEGRGAERWEGGGGVVREGRWGRGEGMAVTTAYRNVLIEDDQGTHFRLVIRNAEGQLRWRCWNFEPDAGKQLNPYLASEGILRQ
ncbi:hypothetical protein CWM40_29105 [Escherichia coli]|nr:hypothetical protein CWM40_29105 [Escherichia coli]